MMLSLQQLAAALGGEVSGNQVLAPGPNHSAADRSMAVKLTPDGYTVHSHAGDDWKACRDHIDEKIGAPKWEPTKSTAFDPSTSILFNPSMSTNTQEKVGKSDPPTAYVYYNADSTPRLRVNRTQNRNPPFWQEHWVDGQWQKGGGDEPKVPYRLPELLEAPDAPVLICEGEKDVDNVRALGDLIATTNAGGAGNWQPDLNQYFKGRDVILIPDHDEPGEKHARTVFENLRDVATSIKVLRLPGLPDKGDISDWIAAGGTLDGLVDLLKAAPAYEDVARTEAQPAKIRATPYVLPDPKTIPQRDWLYGTHLIRGFASATFAPGAAGKTSLKLVEAIAMATGRALLGVKPRRRCRVWYWNGEDPQEEIDRRIAAICIYYGISGQELEGWLFVDTGRRMKIVIAGYDPKSGNTIYEPVVNELIETITANKIDVFVVDPFVKSYRVSENDNGAMDMVATQWVDIAEIANIAIELVHHTKKLGGTEANVESGRGAGSVSAAMRSVDVVNKMQPEEGKKVGIEGLELRQYFSVIDDKPNMTMSPESKTWYRLVPVSLGNGPNGSEGDSVGVATPWKWPDPLAGVAGVDFDKVAAAVRGGDWRKSLQSPKWVGKAVAQALKLDLDSKADKAKAGELVKYWLGTRALVETEVVDEKGKPRPAVKLAEEVDE
jgi:AAA domain-containing protein